MDDVMNDETGVEEMEPDSLLSDYSIDPQETEEALPPTQEQAPDLDTRMSEIEERERAIQKREKELNKGFEEVGRRRRELDEVYTRPQPPSTEEEDPLASVDPEAVKLVERIIERKVSPYMDLSQLAYQELVESEMESFARAHEIDPEELTDTVRSRNLLMTATGPDRASRRQVYETAAQLIAAEKKSSVDIEELVNQRVEAKLAELADKGKQVAAPPRPSRAEPVQQDDSAGFDDDWEPEQKLAFWKARGWLK